MGGQPGAQSGNADRTVFCFLLVLLFIKGLRATPALVSERSGGCCNKRKTFRCLLPKHEVSVSSNNEIIQRQILEMTKRIHTYTVYYLQHTSASLREEYNSSTRKTRTS